MLANGEEDYEDKTFRGVKRGRDFESNEENQEPEKDSDEGDKKQVYGEETDQDYEEFRSNHYKCMISRKDGNMVWRTFDTNSTRMGINREMIRTMVKENKEGKIQMEELIDLTLMILSDITKENPQMDELNNAKNSVVDSYQTKNGLSIKFRNSNTQ